MGIHEDKLGQGEHETENHNTRQDTGLTVGTFVFSFAEMY